MRLTERLQLKRTNALSTLCHQAKNLYNLANFTIRQQFFANGTWYQYYDLYRLLKNHPAYKALPSHTSQQILRLIAKNWKGFFRARADWKLHPEKYRGHPRIPSYKPKNGESIVIFTYLQCRIRQGYLKFPKKILPPIKTRITKKLRQVRILPRGNHYILEIVYEYEPSELQLNKDLIIMIDLGLRNLVTVVNNKGMSPFVIKGGVIKSINQFYNKEKGRLTSIKVKQRIKGETKHLQRLALKRNNKIEDYFHKVSRKIIDYCIANDFGTVVIGHNKGWKYKINIGKRNNQNFVGIPFFKLIRMIHYKAELVGIEVKVENEGYTSLCSFLDGEPIMKHKSYLGKRLSRGLFQASDGTIINADVNGGYNIGRKAVPNAFSADGIEGVGLHPCSITI